MSIWILYGLTLIGMIIAIRVFLYMAWRNRKQPEPPKEKTFIYVVERRRGVWQREVEINVGKSDSGSTTAPPTKPTAWWRDGEFWHGLSTEMAGAVITTILFTFIIGYVEQQSARNDLRQQLINEMASGDNSTALRAMVLLREEGWLTDGSLADANLFGANLQNADLSGADLSGVDLRSADLSGASLRLANLDGADLRNAVLQEVNTRTAVDPDLIIVEGGRDFLEDVPEIADDPAGETVPSLARAGLLDTWRYAPSTSMAGVDLRGADLRNSDLSFADLRGANLLDADFGGANLYMANLRDAIVDNEVAPAEMTLERLAAMNAGLPIFSRDTLLPHGRKWSSRVDMLRFTDPANDDYLDIGYCQDYANDPVDKPVPNPFRECPLPFVTLPYPPR